MKNSGVTKLPILADSPGSLIRRAQQVHTAVWTQHMSHRLTSIQYGILLALQLYPNINQRIIGELVSIDKSTAADVLWRLAQRGIVTRSRDIEDSRNNVINLTARGHALLEKTTPVVISIQEQLLSPLTRAEAKALTVGLQKVAYRGRPPTAYDSVGEDGAWLYPLRLHTAPGHLIRRAQQIHTLLWQERVGSGLTSVQYAVLLVLYNQPRIDQQTLGQYAYLDKSTGGDIIGRLAARKEIVRSKDLVDGRRNLLTLSPSGADQIFDRARDVLDVQDQLLRPLGSEERSVFMSLMTKLVEMAPER